VHETFGYNSHRREGVHIEVHFVYEVRSFGFQSLGVLAHPDTTTVHQAIHAANAVQAECRNLTSMSHFSKKINDQTSQKGEDYTHLLVTGVLIGLSDCRLADHSSSSNTRSIGTSMSSQLGKIKVFSEIISQ
jgi:hypothetical protein